MFGTNRTSRSATRSRDLGIFVGALALCALASACKPKIGDDCTDSTNCSQNGDRVCDSTQPGGYCTIFNCEPGSCPKEATCVSFRSFVSAVPNADGTGWMCSEPSDTRFERTFCMRRCKSDSDCRSGYACVDLGEPGNPYGAEVLDSRGSRVCTIAFTPECQTDAECPTAGSPAAGAGENGGAAGGGAISSMPPSKMVCVEQRCWPEELVINGSSGPETVCSGSTIGAGGSAGTTGSGGVSGISGAGAVAGAGAGGAGAGGAGVGGAGAGGASTGGGAGGSGATVASAGASGTSTTGGAPGTP